MTDFETFLRSLPPDPHLPAILGAIVRAQHHDAAAAERKMKRAMLGGCECGYVRGDDVCPVCDLGIGDAAREGAREVADLAAAMEALAPKKKRAVALTAHTPNRFERRRAAARARSGRW
jgi:hypothetical protein